MILRTDSIIPFDSADVYGHGQHPTLPCMTMQPPMHPAHGYRHLNRSPVPPYRPSCDSTSDSIYDETLNSTKIHPPSGNSMGRSRNKPVNHRSSNGNPSRSVLSVADDYDDTKTFVDFFL